MSGDGPPAVFFSGVKQHPARHNVHACPNAFELHPPVFVLPGDRGRLGKDSRCNQRLQGAAD
eukprot:1319709-Lingulodinium_polyedra.AAC.1